MKRRWNNFKNICTFIGRYRTMKRAFEKMCLLTGEELAYLKEQDPQLVDGLIELGEWYLFFHVDNEQLKKDFDIIKEMVDRMDNN